MSTVQNGIKEYLNNPLKLDAAFGGSGLAKVSSLTGDIAIPVIKSHFICRIELNNGSNACSMLLKSFNIPEFGINFNSNMEQLGFPIPDVSLGQMTIEGYLMKNSAYDLTALYNSQFNKGLLNMSAAPNITIYKLVIKGDDGVDVPSLGAATTAMNAILVGVSGDEKALGGIFASAKDINEDALVIAKNKLASDYTEALYTLERCRFGAPSIQVDQASNDFATVSLKVSYNSIKTHSKSESQLNTI